jgi:hypothetical protein
MGLAHEHAQSNGRLAIALPPSASVVDRAFALLGVREVLSVLRTFQDAVRSLQAVVFALPVAVTLLLAARQGG